MVSFLCLPPAGGPVFNRIQQTYHEYPSKYWILVAATFVDRVGGTLVFPFFTLYITQKFDVGMTQAGLVFGVFAVASFVGNLLGGALSDRFGRRRIVIGGLVLSALSSVALGLADSMLLLIGLAAGVGLLSDMAGPARAAMIADMLPDSQRAEGFGVMRVAGNLAWLVGPTIGGLLATRSYLGLFIGDAITSLITAIIIFRLIPETMPVEAKESAAEPIGRTFSGYLRVLADRPYLAFMLISIVMNLVYLQLYSTLSVYLRDVHNIAPRGYGALMSINAGLVVIAQFWITRRTRGRPPMLVMAAGSALYLVGFTLFGVVGSYPLFIVAMLIVTCGEMLVIPVSQAVVALLAPVEMRGRYMGVFSLSWGIPSAIGPWAAGLIIDNLNPDLVWYLAGLLSAAAILGFIWLHWRAGSRLGVTESVPSAIPSPS
jgi:MFS family permease